MELLTKIKQFSTKSSIAVLAISTFALFFMGINEGLALGLSSGTPIGNKATATYRDADNNTYTSDSPEVNILVGEVCGVDIQNSTISRNALDGQTIDIPIAIDNIGNGENTFTLSENSALYDTKIYLDSIANGVVDPGEEAAGEITSIVIAENGTGKVVLQVTASQAAAASETITFTAEGTLPGACSDTVSITTTIINDAIIDASKLADKNTANSGDTITFTINFNNSGTLTAKSRDDVVTIDTVLNDGIVITDKIPESTTYVANSATGAPTA